MDHLPPMTEKNYRTISNIFNQKIKVVAENLMHKACEEIHGLSLDSEFVDTGIKHVKSIFEDLSKDDLLSRCLHGKTQNQDESFNGTIWNHVLKQRFIKLTFEIGVYDSVAHFNIGNLATLLGKWTVDRCIDDDAFRIKNSCRQSGEYMKTRRRMLCGLRKSKTVEIKKKEGKV